jgi:hypothetical protein
LIDRLAEDELDVTPTQLERWRHLGLIPRAQVVRPAFGGSTVMEHEPPVLDACAILAQVSTRGRPWQYSALGLFDAGLDISSRAVRETALFLLDRQMSGFRRAWANAEAGAEPPGNDPGEWVADVATEAARHMDRTNRRVIRDEVRLAHPTLSQSELREAAQQALIWRTADINVPALLTPQQRRWARTGSDEALDPLLMYPIPLPSERAACVATLTWAEMSLARWLLDSEGFDSDDIPLLIAATWRVTGLRLDEDFAHPERPLDDETLTKIRNWRLEALEDDGEGGTVGESADEPAAAEGGKS